MFIFQGASCDILRTATLFAYSVTQQLWIWRTLQSAPTVSTGNSPQTLLCTHNGELHCVLFFSLSLLFTVDYTVEKKNHTTVTTVIPKIGKILHLVVTVSVTVLQFRSCCHVSHHGLSVYEQEGQVWLPLFFWEHC